jgi:hypothetical protein
LGLGRRRVGVDFDPVGKPETPNELGHNWFWPESCASFSRSHRRARTPWRAPPHSIGSPSHGSCGAACWQRCSRSGSRCAGISSVRPGNRRTRAALGDPSPGSGGLIVFKPVGGYEDVECDLGAPAMTAGFSRLALRQTGPAHSCRAGQQASPRNRRSRCSSGKRSALRVRRYVVVGDLELAHGTPPVISAAGRGCPACRGPGNGYARRCMTGGQLCCGE